MYAAYFGLSETPFSIAPNPRYLYMGQRHKEAMAHLLYGIREGGGFVLLTGEVGTGKTTLCRRLLVQLPEHVDVALVLNPQISEGELLATICDELKLSYPEDSSPKTLLDTLNAHLLASYAQGRRSVLIIDEAQLLTRSVLEQVRILTNLETARHKLLQIILLGQPELVSSLKAADLRQLAQRITARYHLAPLSRVETAEYIRYRVSVAGGVRPLFTRAAVRRIYRHSRGVPRLVNVICDRALLGAYAESRTQANRRIVDRAAAEVLGDESRSRGPWRWAVPLAATASILLVAQVREPLRDLIRLPGGPEKSTSMPVPGNTLSARAPEPGSLDAPQTRVFPPPAASDAATERVGSVAEAASTEASAEAPSADVPGSDPGAQAMVASENDTATDASLATMMEMDPATTTVLDDAPGALEDSATPQAPPLADLLRGVAASPGTAQAFPQLAQAWGLTFEQATVEEGCRRVAHYGLKCLRRFGNWNKLRGHNRAALLSLWVDGGEHQVLISALADDSAVIEIDGQSYTYALSDLDALWYGEYVLLWRPPPLKSLALGINSAGPDVLWLRQALSRASAGRGDIEIDKANFDEALREHVMGFQREQAIPADGIVGVETLIRLQTKLDGGKLPLLFRAPTS